MSSRREIERRLALLAALAILILVAFLVWSSVERADRTATVDPTRHAGFADPEVRRVDAAVVRAPEGSFTVDFDRAGRIVLAVDAGVAPVSARVATHPLAFDTCDEALPEEALEVPEGLAVVHHERVRVAFDAAAVSLDEAREIARQTDAALDEAAAYIGAPRREELLVIAYASPEAMGEALGGPSWATAAYDGAVHVVASDAERSLRHEVMHAQLHQSAPCAPYWLSEGLASRLQREDRDLDFLRMVHVGMWIPFASLSEPIEDDEGTEHMSDPEVDLLYAQTLAMVWMLETRGGDDAIARAVRASRDGMPRPLSWDTAMPGVDGDRLLRFLGVELFPELSPETRATLSGRGYVCVRQPDPHRDGTRLRCAVRDA